MPAEEDMKHSSFFKFISITLFGLTVLNGCSKNKNTDAKRLSEVVVYTYDSFLGEWGAGPQIEKLFEDKTGLNLTFVDCGDGLSLLNRATFEKKNVQADVILGLDNYTAYRAIEEKILDPYKPQNAETLLKEELEKELSSDWSLTPYDYSHFAIIFNKEANVAEPKSLTDLTNQVYSKKIILMDPRTSTPGLGFFAWTLAVYGEKAEDYWKALKPNILTMSSGWSEGWGLFQNGEAPLVISYTTSPASDIEYNNMNRYDAPVFTDGHIIQVEGCGILKNCPNKEGAKKFIDFIITDDAQKVLPLTQWMIPANKNVELPDSYKKACPTVEKTLSVDPRFVEKNIDKIMAVLEK